MKKILATIFIGLLAVSTALAVPGSKLFILDVDGDPDDILPFPQGEGTYHDTTSIPEGSSPEVSVWTWSEGQPWNCYIYYYLVSIRISPVLRVQSTTWNFPNGNWSILKEAYTNGDGIYRWEAFTTNNPIPPGWCKLLFTFSLHPIPDSQDIACSSLRLVQPSCYAVVPFNQMCVPPDMMTTATICRLDPTQVEYSTWSRVKTLFK